MPVESAGALSAGEGAPDLRREFIRSLVRQPAFLVGAAIILFWVVCAIFGPLFAGSPYAQNLLSINQGPSGAHWFGTDQLGRDMFARVLVGSRDVLIIAPWRPFLARSSARSSGCSWATSAACSTISSGGSSRRSSRSRWSSPGSSA